MSLLQPSATNNGTSTQGKPTKEKKPRKRKAETEAEGPSTPKKNKRAGPEGVIKPKQPRKKKAPVDAAPPMPPLNKGQEEQLRRLQEEEAEREKEDEENEEDNIFDEEDVNTTELESTKMRTLLSLLSPEQMSRYEYYRRSSFKRSNIKKLMNDAIPDAQINQKMAIVMSGVAKVFTGELMEAGIKTNEITNNFLARSALDESGEDGPIRPRHIREAYRRLKQEGKIPYVEKTKLFTR